jgi:hypothetical protein
MTELPAKLTVLGDVGDVKSSAISPYISQAQTQTMAEVTRMPFSPRTALGRGGSQRPNGKPAIRCYCVSGSISPSTKRVKM